ncbi:MAG: UvrD-helicase domain-containing protein [Muribaculaceae bacterium]|nr:UvrD-helicase domain-containing protein [Muribaculaceae bacterium]
MSEESYLDRLNPAQRAAVEYCDGPELVIAGAGSGKTRVLTYKIVHLLHLGYKPRRIMALTFTNKAAREMLERIQGLVGEETTARLWAGTFHSIFSRILRMHAEKLGFKSNFTIYDSSDSKSLIKSIIKELNLDDKFYRPGAVAADISKAKNALFSAADYERDRDLMRAAADCKRPRTAEIYRIYTQRCKIAGAMDFDDLLYYTNVLLRDFPDVKEELQEYFSYVLVDEYQDTNFAQHLIISQLCAKHKRLCVVGDDAQSIYSFRGANIRNILNLEKSFPNLRTFKLEENYRSTKSIIGAANSLIANNSMQIPKEVYSNKATGEPIEVNKAYNDYEEAYTLATRIRSIAMRSHDPLSEFAVLYRTNAQSRVLEEALRNRNIPYRIYGGLSFYQRAEVKDALSYFRLAVNPDDDEALRRVINKPARGIGDTTMKKVVSAAIAAGVSLWSVVSNPEGSELNVNKGTAGKLKDFAEMIRSFNRHNDKGMPAPELAREIISKTQLLQVLMTDHTPESISKKDNLLELLKAVDDFASARIEQGGTEAAPGLGDFLAEVSLLTDQDEDDGNDEKVTLMTIHAAKGLEFSNVFIVGVEEELLPSGMSMNSAEEIEEERRLMYVAITRAKERCVVSYASQRMVNGQTRQCAPSRFLHELDSRYLRLMSGTTLGHRPAGSGTASYRRETIASTNAAKSPTTSAMPRPQSNFRPAASARPAAPVAGSTDIYHGAAELREGMRIRHPRFLNGVIERIDTDSPDTRIEVSFDDGSRRTLLLKFARFTILD